MAVLNAGFQLGANAATIATSDRGDGDAWDIVVIGTSAAAIYDTAHPALGAQSGKFSTGASSVSCFVGWSTLFGTQTNHYGRTYLYFTANPAANLAIIAAPTGANNNTPSVQISTAGKLRLLDQAGTQQAISTNAISLNQLIRVEYHFIHSATVGQLEAKLFNTATSGTATETVTTSANLNTNASTDRILFGVKNVMTNQAAFWMGQIQAGASAYPGVAPVGVSRAQLSGVGV